MSDVPAIVDSTLSNALQALSRALLALGPESVSPDPLTESDIEVDGVCPICLVSFRAHLAEEEMASVMESPAHASGDLGVTRLQGTCKQHTELITDTNPRTSGVINENGGESPVQDNPETAAARLVNDVIRDVLDRLSPSGSGLTNTDLHTLLESVLPTLIPPISQTESSDPLDLETDYRSEFGGMYS
ncbi:hypothetical protein Clacol_001790 [Clathrus columnatus]|uniref:Uncharacterized protein n=1 Tax=Clathrus columnatus TaxID=1419009 RepID=A0AAV5A2C0_9AGAM|nr:hypothetical protein Clacol_001790 [Clathrus columnatus]